MRIVISGGSGLIGRSLTKELISNGHQVTILSRNPDAIAIFPTTVRAVQWDGKTLGRWVEEIGFPDAIINLAGENLSGERFFPDRWTKARKSKLINSRLDPGRVLTNAVEMMDKKPTVFIQASGISYYGTDPDKEFTEESDGGNGFLSELSRRWEDSTKSIELLGIRRVIIRSGIVLSTQGGALTRLLLPYKLFVGGPLGDGRQFYTWIHIDDETRAIRFLVEDKTAEGVFNLTSPHPATNSEFGKTIAKIWHRPHYFPIPALVMNLAFGEVASVVLEGLKVLPIKLIEHKFGFLFPTLPAALEDLNHSQK